MHTHSRTCLPGPVTESREWWRQLDSSDDIRTNNNEKQPMFRAALVEHVRREIAAGTYDTPEKFEIALDRLLRRIEAEDA